MGESMKCCRLLILYSFLFSSIRITTTTQDRITLGQSIRDSETVVSADERFELGFFNPGTSRSRYLGIWYKKVTPVTTVWVANRDTPISDSSGILRINARGFLVLLNSTNDIVWSSNASRTAQNPVAVLFNSGNLIVKDGNDNNPDNFLWQSFDYPGDTLLPGMKLGKNLVTGLEWSYTSWKSTDDPSQGNFTQMIDPRGSPQLFLKKGTETLYRAGSWNGLHWTGSPLLKPNPLYAYNFVSNEKEVYYSYEIVDSSVLSRVVVTPSGVVQRFTWINQTRTWVVYYAKTRDECDNYDKCGAYASCNIDNFPVCTCFKGFVPKSQQWNVYNWSAGCVRRAQLDCEHGDGFLKREAVKLPDTSHSWAEKDISLAECEKLCLNNCSCKAYATLDIRERGSGCLLWSTDLIDIRDLIEGGEDLYVRVAASELGDIKSRRQPNRKKQVIIIAWRLWNEERAVELIDKSLDYSSASSEILRCIHVGLLCVQQGPEDRPNMSTVALMLGGDGSLPQPKQPGFFTERNLPESESSSSKHQSSSTYEITMSLLDPQVRPDTITLGQSVRDGERETVVSADERFELGFFSPGTSRSRYQGIWYKKVAPLITVWVANRDTPVSDVSGLLRINARGIIVLNSTNGIVWSSNASRTPQNPVAVLLKSGILVAKDENDKDPDNILWQSFDCPGDTLLPGMKLGTNLVTGQEWFVLPWKSTDYPSQEQITGIAFVLLESVYTDDFVSNKKEVFYTYHIQDSSALARVLMNPSGVVQLFTWIDETHTWAGYFEKTSDKCDNYAQCGAYASCNINNFPICTCLEGFVPKSPGQWKVYNWSAGCVRKAPLDYIREGESSCLLLFTDLIDIRIIFEDGQDLYVRGCCFRARHPAFRFLLSGDIELRRQPNRKKQVIIIAWRLWNEERAVELIVESLGYSSALSEILRCIHVGQLCVQQGPKDRPNMSTVALMLGGDGSLPHPKQPACFFTERNLPESESSSSKNQSSSTYEITISLLEPP
ncbi:hypothetical protein JRO89_XS15G0136500 [Xanthoceras sorbifolium]|uniref:Uncharacterized protein n=1 Tax=Xanthoceras sorbifolium TaxID=99658 RepID=A0ABQ8H211_9ROSI|nr:hypothetical protein JRO89_XS15G0136500 [Xanthoceras sorbifolium]